MENQSKTKTGQASAASIEQYKRELLAQARRTQLAAPAAQPEVIPASAPPAQTEPPAVQANAVPQILPLPQPPPAPLSVPPVPVPAPVPVPIPVPVPVQTTTAPQIMPLPLTLPQPPPPAPLSVPPVPVPMPVPAQIPAPVPVQAEKPAPQPARPPCRSCRPVHTHRPPSQNCRPARKTVPSRSIPPVVQPVDWFAQPAVEAAASYSAVPSLAEPSAAPAPDGYFELPPQDYSSLEDYLARNTARGILALKVLAGPGDGAPVPGAGVDVLRTINGTTYLFHRGVTDANGSVGRISLPAPDKSLSFEPPHGFAPYALYTVSVTHGGYAPQVFENVMVFPDTEAVQVVRLGQASLPLVTDEGRYTM